MLYYLRMCFLYVKKKKKQKPQNNSGKQTRDWHFLTAGGPEVDSAPLGHVLTNLQCLGPF